jgi:adenylate cyclase, class 2
MSMEIEKKYRLDPERVALIVDELAAVGAVFEGEDFEENTIYGGPIMQEGGIVRIRTTQDRAVLTFKRRVETPRSDAKHQIEYETEISDAAATDKIIRELGLLPRLVYEKRRKTWRLRNIEIVLDELPFGLFMEIEGSITSIKEAEMLLGIEDLDVEHETYPLLTSKLGRPADGVIEARFT